MKEDNKKVIMVDGKRSEWYEKAIFIMRSDINTDNKPIDFVNEAEKIINSYMVKSTLKINEIKNKQKSIKVTKNTNLNLILNICLLLSVILLGITVYRFFV